MMFFGLVPQLLMIKKKALSTTIKETLKVQVCIYTNSVSKYIKVKGSFDKKIKYQIININGIIDKQGELISDTITITDIQKGIYFLKLAADNEVFIEKF